jgi:hypothetical protein
VGLFIIKEPIDGKLSNQEKRGENNGYDEQNRGKWK